MPEPDLGASPRALRAAGLTRDPFAEPGLWPEGEGYLDDARSQILAQLGAPDAYGAPAVLLLGLQGMGKTALLAGALQRLPDGWRALALSAASAKTEPLVLAQLARSLGLDLDLERPTAVLWRELEDELAARLDIGERLLLAVDDADRLEAKALGALLEHLAPLLGATVGLVLAGPPAFEEHFDASLREYALDLSVELMTLSPLHEPGTAAYVSQRWEAASVGGKARRALGSADLARIHLLSGGTPGGINDVARSILLAQRHPWRPLLALMGVAALLAFTLTLWIPDPKPDSEPAPRPLALAVPEPEPEPEPLPFPPLESRDPAHYVLQLHVLSTGARAQGWIDRQKVPDAFSWRQRDRGDVVVLYGDFASGAEARAAAAQLKAQGLGEAWIRRVRSVLPELAPP